MPKRAKWRRPLDGDGFGREDLGTWGLGDWEAWRMLSLVTPSPRHPVTPSPRHPVTPSPRHPVTPLPRYPVTPLPPFAAHPYTGLHHRLLDNRKGMTALSSQRKPNEATQMNNKSITPNPQQPVDRVPTGQLPSALAELSEATLEGANVLPGIGHDSPCRCSWDGDDE
jgi:bacteriocin leader peptide (microcyclamide/patellamide family)